MDAIESAYSQNREFHTSEFLAQGAKTEVLWRGGEKSQQDRFRQIVRLLPDLTGKSILDVGCGFGDFLAYIESQGVSDVLYTGIDLCAEMIDECRRRLPSCEFHQTGVIEFETPQPAFDFAIASGVFAMPSPDWEVYVSRSIKSMFNLSREGIAVNFLSDYSQSPSPQSQYANPGKTLDLLMSTVSPWATLAHDYRWNDFTIALFHEPKPRGDQ